MLLARNPGFTELTTKLDVGHKIHLKIKPILWSRGTFVLQMLTDYDDSSRGGTVAKEWT